MTNPNPFNDIYKELVESDDIDVHYLFGDEVFIELYPELFQEDNNND